MTDKWAYRWARTKQDIGTTDLHLSEADAIRLSESQVDNNKNTYMPLWALGEDGLTLEEIGHQPSLPSRTKRRAIDESLCLIGKFEKEEYKYSEWLQASLSKNRKAMEIELECERLMLKRRQEEQEASVVDTILNLFKEDEK